MFSVASVLLNRMPREPLWRFITRDRFSRRTLKFWPACGPLAKQRRGAPAVTIAGFSPLSGRAGSRWGETAQAALAGRLGKAQGPVLLTCLGEDGPIADTAEAYLKLHLLSHRLCLPNSLNLDGIFAALPTWPGPAKGPLPCKRWKTGS